MLKVTELNMNCNCINPIKKIILYKICIIYFILESINWNTVVNHFALKNIYKFKTGFKEHIL